MVDTDWREILSFAQKELNSNTKEELCEHLSWMEADDIELNFTDLKTLFKLAQDILKYKNEQVNNLTAELQITKKKLKRKSKVADSPTKSSDNLETITQQEDQIRANKEVVQHLLEEIAELEGRKEKLDKTGDRESDSSRDALSEMNAVEELENEVILKNRHLRKLLSDVKILEEENLKFKEKTALLKDKLSEATQVIENLTEQLLSFNAENNKLKECLGKCEEVKSQLNIQIDAMQKKLDHKDADKSTINDDLQAKIQHWKSVAKARKLENETLTKENSKLQEVSHQVSDQNLPKENNINETTHRKLQEKLSEASIEILQSAKLIETLKLENKLLKANAKDLNVVDNTQYVNAINECDDGKERMLISKLKEKVSNLQHSLKAAEDMLEEREKDILDARAQIKILQSSDTGIYEIIKTLNTAKQELKMRDNKIKSLVRETNTLHENIDSLQLEIEAIRQKYNIDPNAIIRTQGINNKYKKIEEANTKLVKKIRQIENKCLTLELEKHNNKLFNESVLKLLNEKGIDLQEVTDLLEDQKNIVTDKVQTNQRDELPIDKEELNALIDENEGLRKGLQEILMYLKENSVNPSGTLELECPSLESVLHCLDARHAAGWFAPHMATMLELKSALGGRDALLTALQDARKEIFEVTSRLSEESQKTTKLEQKLKEVENISKVSETLDPNDDAKMLEDLELGSWMFEVDPQDIDFTDKRKIDEYLSFKNSIHQKKLQNVLKYFYEKFKTLLNKITDLAIKTADEKNEWFLQEEHYKVKIEQLTSQNLQKDEEDNRISSPGAVDVTDSLVLQRKCEFLEECYKYIRTTHENLKNEFLEYKKESLMSNANNEIKIKKLILSSVILGDKLRESISIDIFYKQNCAYDDIVFKYRELLNSHISKSNGVPNLINLLQQDKADILANLSTSVKGDNQSVTTKNMLADIEQSVLNKQVERLCKEITDQQKIITELEKRNLTLQDAQSKSINDQLKITSESEKVLKQQIMNLTEENVNMKEECCKIKSKLEATTIQIQEANLRQINNDMEINMLRHQVLDLQSNSDSKAIIARLSSEVMVAHLQASEIYADIERLQSDLEKETQKRLQAEDMLTLRENIFSVYAQKYAAKFRYMNEILQALKEQYQGSLPIVSLESYLNKVEDASNKQQLVDEKLNNIEDLQMSLSFKHGALEEILELHKTKCLDEDSCPHKLKFMIKQNIHSREVEYLNSKIASLESERKAITDNCNKLEKTLILVNQGLHKTMLDKVTELQLDNKLPNLKLEDVNSDDEASSRKSLTITLPKPQLLKSPKEGIDMTKLEKRHVNGLPGSPIEAADDLVAVKTTDVFVQTPEIANTKDKGIQTENYDDHELENAKRMNSLQKKFKIISNNLSDTMILAQRRSEEVLNLNSEKDIIQKNADDLKKTVHEQKCLVNSLKDQITEITKELNFYKTQLHEAQNSLRNSTNDENKSLLMSFKKYEDEKNLILEEYKTMLTNERQEFANSTRELNKKVLDLQAKLDRKGSDSTKVETVKGVQEQYSVKIIELEDECFKLQSKLDECKTEMSTYQGEAERWKELAGERLMKMEMLTSQLEKRHSHEVESYKAENMHWMSQLNVNQRDQSDLRNRLAEQKTKYSQQIHEKDDIIEHLRGVISGLETRLSSMQSVVSISDPGFDLSAILEGEGDSEGLSQKEHEQIDFTKCESMIDVNEDTFVRIPASSTAIWQEPVIDRLRRDAAASHKQNCLLRRQVRALAARERRARLAANNLRSQLTRIPWAGGGGGGKAGSPERSLQARVTSLQAQLSHAQRDSHAQLALWDKWKRAQQAAERWQAKFEEKCREVSKLESTLELARSAVTRLEREKRMLLNKVADNKQECFEEASREVRHPPPSPAASPPAPASPRPAHAAPSTDVLLQRVAAQQRRIAALELLQHGNESLVSEYEKTLAEVTSLRGQVLKLESSLLQTQIRSPTKTQDLMPELEHWKSYCEMLKEENVQLVTKLSSIEAAPSSIHGHQHRVNDLEQTVLTLRGLVSKLQAENKSSSVNLKRVEPRPSSSRASISDKELLQYRNKLESYRVEIANLKRSISDKDNLLERSKEMLKIAAEREDTLLRENTYLRRQIQEYRSMEGRDDCLS